MSFRIKLPDQDSTEHTVYELKAAKTIFVPPLCSATIPHEAVLESIKRDRLVILIPELHAFEDYNLIINASPVGAPTSLKTSVFNMSNQRITVAKGDVISRLVSMGLN